MTVTDVHKDPAALTLAITSEFEQPVERIWLLWSDPRQLERWWGPPGYPATMESFDLSVGGVVTYYMAGPDEERYRGWWRFTAIEAPSRLAFQDGFGDHPDAPAEHMPSQDLVVELTSRPDGGTRMTMTSTFPTIEAMERLLEMGMDEGLVAALGQVEGILAEMPLG